MDAQHRMGSPTPESKRAATALVGGLSSAASPGWQTHIAGGDGSVTSRASMPAANQGSAGRPGADAVDGAPPGPTDPWPTWAGEQLLAAVAIADRLGLDGHRLAAALRRTWYAPELDVADTRPRGPLGGLYRRAHAGSGMPITADGVSIVDRFDVIGPDGWWRTWGDHWNPTQSRAQSVHVLFSPRPDALAEFVTTMTAALLAAPVPWLLACTTDARRLRRAAAAVLYVPDAGVLAPELADRLRPYLAPATPALCLPVAPGIAVSEDPRNGMSFGAHRCRLIARALTQKPTRRDRLQAIAEAFVDHGIDPAAPHRSARS